MKKKSSPKLLIIVVVVILLVGAAAVYLLGGKDKMGKAGSTQNGNAFTSIRDALSKSVSLECEATDSEGRITKAYIKNGAVRADMTDPDPKNSGSIIMKDKTMYFWNGPDGFMMNLVDEPNETSGSDSNENEGDKLLDDLENYKQNCKPALVSDSLFTPPADVTFTDMQKTLDGKMDDAEVKKMMEKYGDDSGT